MRHIYTKLSLVLSVICAALPAMASAGDAHEGNKSGKNAPPHTHVASKPQSSEDSTKLNKVAVLSISGPKIFDIDADEIWKLKTGLAVPKQGELIQLSRALQDSLSQQLSARLGATMVPQTEVAKMSTRVAPAVGSTAYQQEIAKALHARYVVDGTIDRVEFDGNTVLPDAYAIIVSMRIVDATTGQAVWSEDLKKFHTKIYTKKSMKSVSQNFIDEQIPDMASYFATRVAQALGR